MRGLFVTRRPVPAAYTASPRIEFTTLEDLPTALGYLKGDRRNCDESSGY